MDLCLIFPALLALFPFSQLAQIGDYTYKSYKDYKVFKIEGNGSDLEFILDYMKKLDENLVYSNNRKTAQVLVAPLLAPTLKTLVSDRKLKATLLVDDYSKVIARETKASITRAKKGFSWTAYYDVDDIYAYLTNTSRAYPKWTEVITGGSTYEKRQILGLRINTPYKRRMAEGKPAFFIESGIHAREWITPATTTYFINQLLTSSDPQIVAMRDQFDWHIFPTVNPDGYHYSYKFERFWRKTRSKSKNGCFGADPNRNWDYNWLKNGATDDPCDYQTYAGASPFSEVETKSLAEYISGVENLQVYVGFHSDAQMLLVPYSDSTEHDGNYDDLITIGKTSLDYGYKVNGAKYDGPATAAEILYKASGGSMDWVRNNLSTPLVYTYELRGRYFQWPALLIYQQGDEVTQMMLGLVTEANNLGYL